MSQWFVARDGKQQGPVSQDGLRQAIRKGKVKASDMVWNDTLPNWVTAGEVPELADVLAEGTSATVANVAAASATQSTIAESAPATPSSTPDEWFYTSNGQQQGPVSLDQLKQSLANGDASPQTLVWREGMAEWLSPAQMPELGVAGATAAGMPLGYANPQGPLQYYGQVDQPIYVGFWWRVLAAIIDGLVLIVPNLVIAAAFEFAAQEAGSQNARIGFVLLSNLLTYGIGWLYEALMTSSSKQATLGKMACGFIVVDANGQRLTFARATARHFAKMLSGIILCIGYIMVAFTERKQGLHDMICSTYVVKK